MSASTVHAVARPPRRRLSSGLSIGHVHPDALGWSLDPVLQVDWFRMSEPYFRPHPHAGFSAVTYLLPESEGAFLNRDSLGDRSRIGPGALHWTEAGSGLLHEEVPEHPGIACDGLQIFVNLPAAERLAPPRIYHVDARNVPTVARASAVVRVLVGNCDGTLAAIRPRTEAVLWDVALEAGARLVLPVEPHWRLTGLVRTGTLVANGVVADEGCAVQFEAGTELVLVAGDAVRVAILGGAPLGEPLVAAGPFVMSDRAQLAEAEQRYRRGGMGHLEPSF